MKNPGDMSEEHRSLATALLAQEAIVSQDRSLTKEEKAQGFTCLAHDWSDIDLEEEGNRLLLRAEAMCPGYFKTTINQQTQADANFAFLVERLTAKIITLLAGNLRTK